MDEDSKPPGRLSSTSSPDVPQAEEEEQQETDRGSATSGGKPAFGSSSEEGRAAWSLPDVVLATYLLNPLLAGQCAALSGDVLGRVLPLAALVAAGTRRPGLTAGALAAATCLWRFYAAPLILPAALMLNSKPFRDDCGGVPLSSSLTSCGASSKNGGDVLQTVEYANAAHVGGGCEAGRKGAGKAGRRGVQDIDTGKVEGKGKVKGSNVDDQSGGRKQRSSMDRKVAAGVEEAEAASSYDPRYFKFDRKLFFRLCMTFTVYCVAILAACWLGTSGSWDFLSAAVKGQLLCENLTPNAGLYWYLFAELFSRFRGFFRVLFLSHPYVYVLPATLRFGMFPEALVRKTYIFSCAFGCRGRVLSTSA